MKVLICKTGNLIDVSVAGQDLVGGQMLPDSVRHILEPQLTYQKKKLLFGAGRIDSVSGKRLRRVEVSDKLCYRYDTYGRLVTHFGLAYRIAEALKGFPLEFKSNDKPRPEVYTFNWERLESRFGYRALQRPCMEAIVSRPCGVIDACTGFGKLVMITMTCLGFDQATISVVTKRGPLVNKIRSFLSQHLPNVGQIGAAKGKSFYGDRITVYTCASAHKANFDSDILLVDEGHEALSDTYSASLARFHRSRNYAFTASPTGRIDGTDIRLEALFGRKIFHLPYQRGVELGLVVPMRVEWVDVYLTNNPAADLEDIPRKRWGLWRNNGRNMVIAKKAQSFGSDEQVLILVETIDHAVHLRKHLPEYTLVYDKLDTIRKQRWQKENLLPENEPEMTSYRKEELRQAFEKGTLKKVIATKMWSTGIDPTQLTAVVRADAGESEIADIQAPGRVSRIDPKTGKEVGIVVDFRDQFDANFNRKARQRQSHYTKSGWEQFVTLPDGSLAPL